MKKSPKINRLTWGSISVEGVTGTYRDVKLYPSGSREWDWNETGTHHRPGIQPSDVQELIAKGAKVVVLSKGHHERLRVNPETLKMLEEAGIVFHLAETAKAVGLYNRLVEENQNVGALIHSTC